MSTSSVGPARPAPVVAACVLVVLHAATLVGRTLVEAVGLLAAVHARPELGRAGGVLMVAAVGWAFSVLVAAGELVVVVGVWRGRVWARTTQLIWSSVAGVIGALGVIAGVVAGQGIAGPTVLVAAITVALCAAVVVLLRLSSVRRWFAVRAREP